MDIARPGNQRRRRVRRVALALSATVAVLIVVTLGLSRLQSAAPSVDRTSLWIDVVKRGPMAREVRGAGTLVPEDIQWISATTPARVDRIVLRPGTQVQPETVILELSNPQLEQELEEAQLNVKRAEAVLENLRVELQNEYLAQKASLATVTAAYSKAKVEADMNEALARDQLVSQLVLLQSRVETEQLAIRNEIAKDQLAGYERSIKARLAVQQADLDQAHAMLSLKRRQHDELRVRAGVGGTLQIVAVDAGQQVAPGTNLARVANPSRLKAEIKISETQAKDLQIGQAAAIDTRNGIIQGVVARIDPSVQNGTRTVDVTLIGTLPKGAVPDLTVDGTIELERLSDAVFVGRPSSGQEQSAGSLFKVSGDEATRVQVKFGRSSVSVIELLSGLNAGDRVVVSDMSAWDGHDRLRLE